MPGEGGLLFDYQTVKFLNHKNEVYEELDVIEEHGDIYFQT